MDSSIHAKEKLPTHERGDEKDSQTSTSRKNIGTKDKSFTCEVCNRTFSRKVDLHNHFRSHKSNKETFSSENKYSPTHINEKPLASEIFDKRNSQPSTLDEKIRTKDKSFVCEFCNKKLSSKTSLLSHTGTFHTDDKVFCCEFCKEEFLGRDNFLKHVFVHSNEEMPYICGVCKERFSEKSSLIDHICTSNREGSSNQICVKPKVKHDVCDKNAHLNGHPVIHTDLLSCEICCQLFNLKNDYFKHLHIHKNKKPFVCKVCKERFLTNLGLKRHSAMQHNKESRNRSSQSSQTKYYSFFCEICKEIFNRVDLNYHCYLHKKQKPFNEVFYLLLTPSPSSPSEKLKNSEIFQT